MSERDELARDIFLADNSNAAPGLMEKEWDENPTAYFYAHHIADGLIAKYYRKPRQVTTMEELKALRLPAIIDSPAGGPARVEYYAGPGKQQRYVEPLFCDDDSDTECYSPEFFAAFGLPATVLLEAAK